VNGIGKIVESRASPPGPSTVHSLESNRQNRIVGPNVTRRLLRAPLSK
jgi:hypothetical protein